ncbi:hypothetical protein ACIHCX_35485 [Streptomyces sp. NPDC052043]|uniref:hypothetical protein n=1 Tax=Streptomyces sp. NPDC052043 TaxID=3365684 RepID=UPI0037CE358A
MTGLETRLRLVEDLPGLGGEPLSSGGLAGGLLAIKARGKSMGLGPRLGGNGLGIGGEPVALGDPPVQLLRGERAVDAGPPGRDCAFLGAGLQQCEQLLGPLLGPPCLILALGLGLGQW